MNNKAIAAIALLIIVCAPIGMGYILNMEDVDHETWNRGGLNQINDYVVDDRISTYTPYTGIMNNYYGYYVDTSTSGKLGLSQLDFVSVTSTYSSVPIYGEGTPETVTSTGASIDLGSYGGDNYKVAFDNHKAHDYAMTLVGGGGMGLHFDAISGDGDPSAVQMIKEGTTVTIEGSTYNNIESVSLTITSGAVVTITPTDAVVGYAEVSQGWYVDANKRFYWDDNRQNSQNYSMIYMVDMPVSTDFYMYGSNISTLYTHFTRDASGVVTIEQLQSGVTTTYTLGNYQYLMIEYYRFDPAIVSGIGGWPQMGVMPAKLNTIELDHPIDYLHYMLTSSDTIHFRIDRAEILSSTMLVANNATINVNDLKPGMTSYDLEVSDVQIVGDSVTFAGTTYPVVAGKITVNSRTIDITKAGLTFTSRTTDSATWDNYINNIQVDDTASIQYPTLNGAWGGANYLLYGLTMTHDVRNEWVPGGFDFDTSMIGIIGLACCAAAFIILGMTGARSGGKTLWLAIICGGGALVFLFII